ncbi:MAG: hypothetical protein JO250_15915 [Armatimonadetes bacterium]|nr:hypothetical protein [Armatimonadota bacterium]
MTVEEIKDAIAQLSAEEREQVREFLVRRGAEEQECPPEETREQRRDRQLAAIIQKDREEFGPLIGGQRPFGLCAGQLKVPDDFDDPLPEEILRLFEDGPVFPSE